MKTKDWLPSGRDGKLSMAKTWKMMIANHQDAWKVPEEMTARLNAAIDVAGSENSVATGDRSAVSNMRLKMAFDELTAAMRDIKKRYFFNPPLNDADFVALGLNPKDVIPTTVENPVGLVTATIKYPNEGALELNVKHVEGTPFDRRANYGVKINYGVFPFDAPAPTHVNQLVESRFTRKKKELFTFDRADRQKMAYFCLRYENSKGKEGQWGAIIPAVIP